MVLDVLDTSGQEEYASLQDQWIREGDAYVIVYSITRKDTFEEARILREKIIRIRDDDQFPLVLVGARAHLEDERSVSKDKGQEVNLSLNI